MAYEIIDRQTGQVVGTTRTRRAALRQVDRLDTAYGAARYTHREMPIDADARKDGE